MAFQVDQRVAREGGRAFGEYLITFISRSGQVRSDLFRNGKLVVAHVSFPTGLDAGSVTDPYVGELWNYARQQGFPDHFKLVLS